MLDKDALEAYCLAIVCPICGNLNVLLSNPGALSQYTCNLVSEHAEIRCFTIAGNWHIGSLNVNVNGCRGTQELNGQRPIWIVEATSFKFQVYILVFFLWP